MAILIRRFSSKTSQNPADFDSRCPALASFRAFLGRKLVRYLLVIMLSGSLVYADESRREARVVAAVASASAEQAVELAAAEVLGLIEDAEYAQEDQQRLYSAVESSLRPMIDFPRFARGVMGPFAKRTAPYIGCSAKRVISYCSISLSKGSISVSTTERNSRKR
jgi:hypothetical protein